MNRRVKIAMLVTWWCVANAVKASVSRNATADIDLTLLGTLAGNHYRISGELTMELMDGALPKPRPQADTLLLVSGGQIGYTSYTNEIEVLNLKQDQWRNVAPLPSARGDVRLAVLYGQVYAVGGRGNAGDCTNSVDVYNIGRDTWTAGPPLSDCRYAHCVTVIDSTIYAVGGYDPQEDAWESVPDLSIQGCSEFSLGAVDGALYVVGGYNWTDELYFNSVRRYRPAAHGPGEWSEAPPMHAARKESAVASYRGKLYIVGGYNHGGLDTVEVFDPVTETWTFLDAIMPVARKGASAVVVKHMMHVGP